MGFFPFRKIKSLSPDVLQLGINLFWGFGVLAGFIYFLEVGFFLRELAGFRELAGSADFSTFLQTLIESNQFNSLFSKGFSLFDFLFIFALGFNLGFSPKHRYPKTASLISGFCAALVLKDLVVLLNPDSGFYLLLVLCLSLLAGYFTFLFCMRDHQNVPMLQRDLPPVDYGDSPLQVDEEGHFRIPSKACEFHIQVCGGTGTGKSFRVIKPFIHQDILKNRIGCLIFDVKSTLVEIVVYYASQAGRMKELYYFDLGNLSKSMTWNPLQWGSADEIANRVFKALYPDQDRESAFYTGLASSFLKNLVFLLKLEKPVITFLDLLEATQELDSFKTIHRLCEKYPEDLHSKYFISSWLSIPLSKRRDDLIGLIDKLQRFCNSEWSPLLNTRNPKIVLKEVVENNRLLLFGIDSSRFPADAKSLAILALVELDQLKSDRSKKRPSKTFRIYMDEFYHLIYKGFIGTLNLSREARFSFVMAHQSLSDLLMVSPEFQDQVMINTRSKVVLSQDDSKTANYFSEYMGMEVELDKKIYPDHSWEKPGLPSAGINRLPVRKLRVTPDELKELPEGEAYFRTVFPTGPVLKRVRLLVAANPPADFDLNSWLKDRNHCLKYQEEPKITSDLLMERKYQEPEDPRIKALSDKYSKKRKGPKRD